MKQILFIQILIIIWVGVFGQDCKNSIKSKQISEEILPTKIESQNLLSKSYEFRLPMPFRMQKENYEEGVFYVYSFADTTQIIVFEGAMVLFEVDHFNPEKTYYMNNKRILEGCENNKFWRKDIIGNIKIYYNNVSLNKKSQYDKILDSIKFRSF